MDLSHEFRKAARAIGYDVRSLNDAMDVCAQRRLVPRPRRIVDCVAGDGETTRLYARAFPHAILFVFEQCRDKLDRLRQSKVGRKPLTILSSASFGESVTLDGFCKEHGNFTIDILKIVLNGSGEPFAGALKCLDARIVRLIYVKVLFSEQHDGHKAFDGAFKCLSQHGYNLEDFIHLSVDREGNSYCDAIFTAPDFAEDSRGLMKETIETVLAGICGITLVGAVVFVMLWLFG